MPGGFLGEGVDRSDMGHLNVLNVVDEVSFDQIVGEVFRDRSLP